ncbi:uncharacterized protein [Panulirus ornatus]|uniref:uncharacterized protein n=1 Tax=Panulirus ornatus TaxID=150431 RepID=UPI003A88052B
MAASALAPIMYQLQESLRNVDLRYLVSTLDIQTIGVLSLVVVAVIFLLDLLTKSYAPFGRSLLSSAVHAWGISDQLGLNDAVRGSRSLEPLTGVLDALAEAVMKWEESEASHTVRNRTP